MKIKKELTPDNIQANSVSTNQGDNKIDCSILSIFSSVGDNSFDTTLADELQIKKLKKKKKRGLRR